MKLQFYAFNLSNFNLTSSIKDIIALINTAFLLT